MFEYICEKTKRLLNDDYGIKSYFKCIINTPADVVGDCIPFVSEYTTCTEENKCSGCRKCQCNRDQQWDCRTVHMCGDEDNLVDDRVLTNALGVLQNELTTMEEKKQLEESMAQLRPRNNNPDNVLGDPSTLAKLNSLLRFKRFAPKSENKQKKIVTEQINSKKHNITVLVNKHEVKPNKTDMKPKRSLVEKNLTVIGTKNNTSHTVEGKNTISEQNITNSEHNKKTTENDVKSKDRSVKIYEPIHEINDNNTENKHAKRSIDAIKHPSGDDNHTIKYYETNDELNEDTLLKNNYNQTLQANRVNNGPKSARRSSPMNADTQSLHIDFNNPQEYNNLDNKIDHTDTKYAINLKLANAHRSNYTQADKTKELSKLVVNELHKGSEIIGDDNAPIISNITFTPENDTLTAMAFIAGNLLNKLWNMENDGSHSSFETDAMKLEKIEDLLDLFKEPLNLRQETFLRNALEKLSNALNNDQDIRNVSLCADIEDAKRILDSDSALVDSVVENVKEDQNRNTEDSSRLATIKAVSKINNVLGLIKKFESTQQDLNDLKKGVRSDLNKPNLADFNSPLNKRVMDDNLSVNDKSSLNIYGKVLDKITKLLLPPKKYKKITPKLSIHNILNNNKNLKQKYKDLYNIDISNLTVTAKDKLILDYLTHIDNNPDCLFSRRKAKPELPTMPAVEGNILLNLSEFFKMKSITDLVNILGPENHEVSKLFAIKTTTTTTQATTTQSAVAKEKLRTNLDEVINNQFNSTKDKLKSHLKNIIEDLLELQTANGNNFKSKFDIAEALPCIYKIMNVDQMESKNEDINTPPNAIASLNKLKSVLSTEITRRSGDTSKNIPRPQSAAIWERVIKNIDETHLPKYRRTLDATQPKSIAEIKKMIQKVTNSSIDYKHQALLMEVPPSEKLILLKTFSNGIQNYINVLEDIKLACKDDNLPDRETEDLLEFIKQAEYTVRQDNRILNNVESRTPNNEARTPDHTVEMKISKQPSYNSPSNDEVSIPREQVINQLVKNRMNEFLKSKDPSQYNSEQDINYNIAQKILHFLDVGNYELAGELFKIFNMQQKFHNSNTFRVATTTKPYENFAYRRMMEPKHPLIQFEKPLLTDQVNQDYLIKQLLNIKNMHP